MRPSDGRRSTMKAHQVRGTFPIKTKFTGGDKYPGTGRYRVDGTVTDLIDMGALLLLPSSKTINWVFLGQLSGFLFPGGNVYWPPDDPRTAKMPKDHHPPTPGLIGQGPRSNKKSKKTPPRGGGKRHGKATNKHTQEHPPADDSIQDSTATYRQPSEEFPGDCPPNPKCRPHGPNQINSTSPRRSPEECNPRPPTGTQGEKTLSAPTDDRSTPSDEATTVKTEVTSSNPTPSGSTKKKSRSSLKKLKGPGSDAGDRGDAATIAEDQLEDAIYRNDLAAFMKEDPVMKIVRSKLIGSALLGPVTTPPTMNNKQDAAKTMLHMLKEAGYPPSAFDAHELFDLELKMIVRSLQNLFDKLAPLLGTASSSETETLMNTQAAERMTGSSPHASAHASDGIGNF
ncbi:unnamed protein product [Phytophthora fragariaefolia]|uniref:Unnamed protein product n=1 Tax=Phytophthora fragariaefolia TaxID=1490495 RepID=A0A9W7D458_9STRA|nr:unnamed protein product [Phytophthora fragariaefolia]